MAKSLKKGSRKQKRQRSKKQKRERSRKRSSNCSKKQKRERSRKRSSNCSTRSTKKYSGAWGDKCGINSIIEGDKKYMDKATELGVDTSKNGACYKPCEATEISHPYYCEHVGISPAGQYNYFKDVKGGMDDHVRKREFISKGKSGEVEDDAKRQQLMDYVLEQEKFKKFDNHNYNTKDLTLLNAGKALAKGTVGAGKLLAKGVGGSVGLVIDGTACIASGGLNCNLNAAKALSDPLTKK